MNIPLVTLTLCLANMWLPTALETEEGFEAGSRIEEDRIEVKVEWHHVGSQQGSSGGVESSAGSEESFRDQSLSEVVGATQGSEGPSEGDDLPPRCSETLIHCPARLPEVDAEGNVVDEGEEDGVEEVVGQAGVLVESELERLGVVPGRVVVQPGGGEVLVNVGVVFYADVEVQSFSLELLGYEVAVEVEPVWFEWDLGDGSAVGGGVWVDVGVVCYADVEVQSFSLELWGYEVEVEVEPVWFEWDVGDGAAVVGVEEAGGPFPDHVVSHEYGRSGVYEVGLVTVWDGRFRVVGLSEWVDVGDQPVTEDVFGPLRVVSKTNRLLKTN